MRHVLAALVLGATLVAAPHASAARGLVLDGVPVALREGTGQVITVRHTHGTRARVTLWALRSGHWTLVARTTAGRTGYGGLVLGTKRKQGTGTTPSGTYALPFSFGSGKRHAGWDLPYRRFDSNDYWVEDNASKFYNRFRSKEQGGFRWNLHSKVNGSERLAATPTQYRMAVVIAYNYDAPVHYRGAGIFLHVNGPGATAGCVGAPRWFLSRTLQFLDPTRAPLIAIGR